jgi:hypothetical protein
MDHPGFAEIDSNYLGLALIDAAASRSENIVQMIMGHPGFGDIDPYYLGKALWYAAKKGDENAVQMIMEHKRFKEISSFLLGEALIHAARNSHEKLVKMIMEHERFKEISSWDLGNALVDAVKNGHENIVKMIVQSSRFKEISSGNLQLSLDFALEKGYIGCANWIKAYTALKPEEKFKDSAVRKENEIKEYVEVHPDYKLNDLDNAFMLAYEEFLAGRPNDLRNLVFPIKKDFYALYPEAKSETPPMTMIKRSLLKLFKPDHIKPLLLSLVEKQYQKDAALDILDQMGLIKRQQMPTDPKGAVATKAHQETPKDLPEEKEQNKKDISWEEYS